MSTYKIDPSDLAEIARDIASAGLADGEVVPLAMERLAGRYPHLIDPAGSRWVGSKAGGILGKVRMLYFTPREYVVIFGTPTGTQGFSGRYKRVDIHKFLLSGRIDSYDLDGDDTTPMVLLPGESTHMAKGTARGLTIQPGSWHIEYGRGLVATTLPFAMIDTLLLSLELESVRLSSLEFLRLTKQRLRSRSRRLS